MSTYDDYKLNLNIFAHKNPPCTGERRCNGDDIFIWSWLSTSNLRPANFLQICCALLEQADRQTRLEQEKLHERLEEGKPQQADAKKRKRVKAEKAKDAKNNEEALPPRAKGTRKISRSPPRSKRQKRVGGAEPA
jgi:hypothetical protein